MENNKTKEELLIKDVTKKETHNPGEKEEINTLEPEKIVESSPDNVNPSSHQEESNSLFPRTNGETGATPEENSKTMLSSSKYPLDSSGESPPKINHVIKSVSFTKEHIEWVKNKGSVSKVIRELIKKSIEED